MDMKKLVTLTFDKNVGPLDRAGRLVVGAGIAGVGWYLALPLWASISLSVLGALTVLTSVLSKCSIYYVLGYSSCPVTGQSFPGRAS